MSICIVNQQRHQADRTQNTATSPMLQRWWQYADYYQNDPLHNATQGFSNFNPYTLIAVVIFYFLILPIEKAFNFFVYSWTKYLIAIPLICILTVLTKWTKNSFIRKVFVALAIILIIYSRNISERLFLGKRIAYTYLGQDAGFEELYLFSNGKCKLTYGGIFGVKENHYGTFEIKDTVLLVDTKARLLDLQGHSIKIDSSKFTIQPR